MPVAARPLFDNSFARELEGLYEPWQATPSPEPRLLALNAPLAVELGLDPEALRDDFALFAGNVDARGRRSRRPTPATSSAATRRAWATGARCCWAS